MQSNLLLQSLKLRFDNLLEYATERYVPSDVLFKIAQRTKIKSVPLLGRE